MAEKIATRDAYGNTLVELAENYDFVVLDADLAAATKTGVFAKKYPERHFNCGIAEGNMMSVAAGIAATGITVFASSFAMFATGRAFEQVRNNIGYPHLNVKICATHAGVTVGEDGATHQCLEDIGVMRLIPGMTVVNPADAVEAAAAVRAAVKEKGPMYFRFGRSAVPVLFDKDTYRFEFGKGIQLTNGSDVAIVASGITVYMAVEAAEILKNEGIDARVIDIHTIKPIDRELLTVAARECGAVVTAEEHNVIGGLGSAVAETLAETCPVPILRVGVKDVFGRSGSAAEMLVLHGITPENIAARAREAIELKNR